MIYWLLLAMIFCHIVDDYYLQGVLAKMKQKKWWEENSNNKKYKYDYIVALICHSFSWTFMIMLPIAIFKEFDLGILYILYPINCVVHCITDDLKANKLKINLIADQSIHLFQIILTWLVFYMIEV